MRVPLNHSSSPLCILVSVSWINGEAPTQCMVFKSYQNYQRFVSSFGQAKSSNSKKTSHKFQNMSTLAKKVSGESEQYTTMNICPTSAHESQHDIGIHLLTALHPFGQSGFTVSQTEEIGFSKQRRNTRCLLSLRVLGPLGSLSRHQLSRIGHDPTWHCVCERCAAQCGWQRPPFSAR